MDLIQKSNRIFSCENKNVLLLIVYPVRYNELKSSAVKKEISCICIENHVDRKSRLEGENFFDCRVSKSSFKDTIVQGIQ